jgi:hypothetical protein
MPTKIQPVVLEDVQIMFRNLAGLEGTYNRAGDRNFAVRLPAEIADKMEADGWNVKRKPPREEGDEPLAYISVSVSYKNQPPAIRLISSKGRTALPEDLVHIVDWVEIHHVDLTLNPYQWSVNGNTGVKAYLKNMFVILIEDPLEDKYSDLPELGAAPDMLAIEAGDDIIDAEEV